MLPAWLGACKGLEVAIEKFGIDTLHEMNQTWPFFRTRLEMLEMVFCKADSWLSEHYEQGLVETQYRHLGETLRSELADAIKLVREICKEHTLLAGQPWIRESINLRNPYTDPLNLLQVELLKRSRENQQEVNSHVDKALMITMTGIAAGMRNTG